VNQTHKIDCTESGVPSEEQMRTTVIETINLGKTFVSESKTETEVFNNLNFDIKAGEFVCLIGHSGCGKTTLLNMLGGLEEPTNGSILVDDKEISGPSLDRAMVFQSHALMPWMTAIGNVNFAVQSKWPAWSKKKQLDQSRKFLDLVHLGTSLDKKPSELSGGMKQRVGIARAFAIEPKILLLDEPFSALDALTRGSLQDELVTICRETNQTCFMITHDIDEAILLADRIILMTNGPQAYVHEIVINSIEKPRARSSLYKHENYYPIRNHLMDFLVNKSNLKDALRSVANNKPKIVKPAK
jgi:nitrate/nitrite transport system ATP-binding protein